ncbi:putative peroxidase-related enzyme [Edaphobacter aggregans]|uniref:Putative peroxidase-related enzyme n=1 Tax=Edaphobacter aggregans TaxID=570835 RepID=A0A3R9QJR9_9BACT|nr:peroxidase-related enzyme [Edaphobacter aggregans]RSL18175.1 putative peroxidase-related enzyme [Edaphobacter aggregans]
MSTLKIAQEPMYLRGVEEDPKPSVYRDLIENAKSSGGDYWQIWHLLAFDPEAAHHLVALSHTLMHKPGPLSAGLRELIAAYTSSLNNCEFCMKAHVAVASQLLGDESLVWSVIDDLETSALAEKEKALLRFVQKVTLSPSSITAVDTQLLNQAGWDDASIFYTISACALFNFYNRWISASGVHPVSDEAFKRLGSRMAVAGYAR